MEVLSLWDLHCSGILHSVDWYFVTGILGQPIKVVLHCIKSQKGEDLIDTTAEARNFSTHFCKSSAAYKYTHVLVIREKIENLLV
jgi:hypothetical protein